MNIAEFRALYGLSQGDLAAITGVAQPNIAAMETGKRRVTPRMAERIETAVAAYSAAVDRAVAAAFSRPHLEKMRQTSLTRGDNA